MQVERAVTKPEAFVLPRPPAHQMLRCAFGWNAETTRAFQAEEFDWLELRGGENQVFDIPALGKKKGIKRLLLVASGIVRGLEQFAEVPEIELTTIPKNGVDLSIFTKPTLLRCEWEKALAKQVFGLTSLREMDVVGFSEPDCKAFSALPRMLGIGFTQGRLQSLAGLEECEELEELSLAHLKDLCDLSRLAKLTSLRDLSLTNLPKLQGTLDVAVFKRLRSLYVVSSPLTINLKALHDAPDLELLWLNVPGEGLEWTSLFQKKRLQKVGLLESTDMPSDDELMTLAKQNSRQLAGIQHVGPKKSRQLQIMFRPA
jgi:hypothetical protein